MIYVCKFKDEYGDYVDCHNVRWIVETARMVCGRLVNEWYQFESLEAALEEWGLTPYRTIEDDLTETE